MFVDFFILLQILQIVSGHFHHHHKFFHHRQRKSNFFGLPPFKWFDVKDNFGFQPVNTRFSNQQLKPLFQPSFQPQPESCDNHQGDFCQTDNLMIHRSNSFWCIQFSAAKNEMVTMSLDRSFRFVVSPEVYYRQQSGTGLTFFFNGGKVYKIRISGGNEGMPKIEKVLIGNVDVCSKNPVKNDVRSEAVQSTMPPPPKDVVEEKKVSCGMRKVDHLPLIHGGIAAGAGGDWPWHVALYHLVGVNLIYKCGGALISNGFVVTCAHCLTRQGEKLETEKIRLYLGKTSLSRFDENSKESKVNKMIIHPHYDTFTAKHDIALLKLSTPVTFTSYIQPICLPSAELPVENATGTVIGWGKTENGQLSDDLRQAKMTVLTKMECLESNRDFYGQLLYDGNFCAGFASATPCTGDSGGGLYFRAGLHWILFGLVSTGVETDKGMCDQRYFVLFTDVQKHTKWIMENVQ